MPRKNCGILRVERGRWRRYYVAGGTVIVTGGPDRAPKVFPAWCNHVAIAINRRGAADMLRSARRQHRADMRAA